MKRLFLVLFLLPTGARRATAQVQQVTPLTPSQCEALARAVHGKRLFAPDDTANFAWLQLPGCSDGPRIAADVLRTNVVKQETDGERIRQFFVLFGSVRSSELFAAFKNVVQDGSASTRMRLESMRALGSMRLPQVEWDSGGVELLKTTSCSRVFRANQERGSESDLPRNYVREIIDVMHHAEHHETNDPQVRAQAHCWRVAMEQTLPPDANKITLRHTCGGEFRVTNENPVSVVVILEVIGTPERHATTVGVYSSTTMSVFARGNVRLLFGTQVIGRSRTSESDDDCLGKRP